MKIEAATNDPLLKIGMEMADQIVGEYADELAAAMDCPPLAEGAVKAIVTMYDEPEADRDPDLPEGWHISFAEGVPSESGSLDGVYLTLTEAPEGAGEYEVRIVGSFVAAKLGLPHYHVRPDGTVEVADVLDLGTPPAPALH